MEPSAAALASLYVDSYFKGGHALGYVDYIRAEPNHRRNARDLLRLIGSYHPTTGRLLDVGCAYGFLLDEARRAGWETMGIEPIGGASSYGTNVLGLSVFNGKLNEAHFTDETFDVVTIIGTIEHVPNPIEILKEITRILRTGGLLVLTTVDTAGPIPLFRLKPPEHLYYFSQANLRLALADMGLEVLKSSWYWTSYNMSDFLHMLSLLFVGPVLTPRALAASRFLNAINLRMPTNEMVVIAQKR